MKVVRQAYMLSSNHKVMLSTTKSVEAKSNSIGVSVTVLNGKEHVFAGKFFLPRNFYSRSASELTLRDLSILRRYMGFLADLDDYAHCNFSYDAVVACIRSFACKLERVDDLADKE